MSTEQILRKPANETFLDEQEAHVEHKSSQKVDINILLEKVRAEKKKRKKRKFNFFKSHFISYINNCIYCFILRFFQIKYSCI